jgi:hypothetical protein
MIQELRDHLDDHARVTAGKTGVFLYADTADGAQEAERLRVGRDLAGRPGLVAERRFGGAVVKRGFAGERSPRA